MKYIKLYEDEQKNPQVGDYVICKFADKFYDKNSLKIPNTIGQLSQIINTANKYRYLVVYPDMPLNYFSRHEIKHFSSNKADLDVYIDANKYNI